MPRRILFVHTEGGLGDVLVSSPIAAALRAAYPAATITAWVSPRAAPLLDGHPWFERTVTLAGTGWREQLAYLRRERFDAVVLPWTTGRQALLAWLARIPCRVGQSGRVAYSWTFTDPVNIAAVHGDRTTHWLEIQLGYARALGAPAVAVAPRVHLRPDELAAARTLLRERGVGDAERVAILHVGRGMPLTLARWPIDGFAEAGRRLDAAGLRVVLTGSAAEREIVAATAARIGPRAVALAGACDLRQTCAVIARAAVLVCPDTGPGHIAAALGIPVVAIFAVKDVPIARWHPWGVPFRAVTTAPWVCPRRCRKETCARFECLAHFDPAEVAAAACELAGVERAG